MRGHSLFLLGVLCSASAAATFAGCSDDEESTTPPTTTDAGHDTGSASDQSSPPVDTGTSDTHAPTDAGPDGNPFGPFDCTGDGGGSATELPQHLACTGLYSDWATKTVATTNKMFVPAYPLWSDGAVKTRWVQIPAGQKIDTTDMDEWVFPIGTKFWKEFVVGTKRVETRIFQKAGSTTWLFTTYKWNAAEDDAVRLETGEWAGADAAADASDSYEIPSVAKCAQCHDGRKDKILGFEVVNLSGPNIPAGSVTLASLVADGLLTSNPPVTTLTIPEDTTGKAANALGWMHTNCGVTCHNAIGMCSFKGMYLRLDYGELQKADGGAPSVFELQAYKTTYNVGATIPANTYKRIAPQSTATSAIYFLASHRNPSNPNGQMPPIDTHKIDPTGVQYLGDWISVLP